MKKLILLLVFVAGGLVTKAQDADAIKRMKMMEPGKRATEMTDKFNTELSLSADQKTKVYNACLERAKLMQLNADKNEKDPNTFAVEQKSIISKWEDAMKVILTPEQYQTFKRNQAARQARKK